jgi:hypothetical protein
MAEFTIRFPSEVPEVRVKVRVLSWMGPFKVSNPPAALLILMVLSAASVMLLLTVLTSALLESAPQSESVLLNNILYLR